MNQVQLCKQSGLDVRRAPNVAASAFGVRLSAFTSSVRVQGTLTMGDFKTWSIVDLRTVGSKHFSKRW